MLVKTQTAFYSEKGSKSCHALVSFFLKKLLIFGLCIDFQIF